LILLRILLLPISWLYGLLIQLRNLCYDVGIFRVESISAKVISVGNITTGGTGKTPVVEWIVGRLLKRKVRVAVVSRGYGRSSRGTMVVSDGRSIRSTPDRSGDEAFQIARKFPEAIVLVDEKRVRGARHAMTQCGAGVIVLDDGFQHRSLHRNLDIVLVDVDQPLRGTWMLPSGPRRESVRDLKRADIVVLTHRSAEKRGTMNAELKRITRAPQFEAVFPPTSLVRLSDGMRQSPDKVRGNSCIAFCGIARPEAFGRMLEDLGLTTKEFQKFPDHHRYTDQDLEFLASIIERMNPNFVLTTEKDAIHLMDDVAQRFRQRYPLYYIEIETHISDDSHFLQLLDKALNQN